MPNYTRGEVRWLVEHYQDKPSSKPQLLVKFIDLTRAFAHLSQQTRDILFMVGVIGMDHTTVGFMRDMHRNTVQRQYSEGIRTLTQLMCVPAEDGDYGPND